MRILILIFSFFYSLSALSQLSITTGISPTALVFKELIGTNSGLKIINIKYRGAPYSMGKFSSKAEHIDIKKGIILSTGFAKDATGPNNQNNTGKYLQQPGDRQLVRLANNITFDASVLEFDFVPTYNRIEFQFVFASEEYLEFINKGVNDVFGFFLSEKGQNKIINLAVLPNTNDPISVDNINNKKNAEYFIKNEFWDINSDKIVEGNHVINEYAYTFQFDGLTHWITASADVKPNTAYHLKIAIADAGDGFYDSAVFLKSNSFHAKKKVLSNETQEEVKTIFNQEKINMRGDSTVLELHLNFGINETQTSDAEDLHKLIQVATLLTKNEQLMLKIEGHTDNVGSKEYNKKLSKQRSEFVLNWLISQDINNERLSALGIGASQPLTSNETKEGREKNRRVEFIFY